jgi:hypothetical protein
VPDDPANTGGDDTGGAGGEPSHGHRVEEDRIADRVFDKVKGLFGSLIGTGDLAVQEAGTAEDHHVEGGVQGAQAIRDDIQAQVEAAVGKIQAQKDHEAEHEKMRKLAETPPQVLTRGQKAMWG